MQYRPPNANLGSCYQIVSIVTGDNGWSHLLALVCSFVDSGHNEKYSIG